MLAMVEVPDPPDNLGSSMLFDSLLSSSDAKNRFYCLNEVMLHTKVSETHVWNLCVGFFLRFQFRL